MADLGPDGDHWLLDPMNDERDWTDHLGRQLGMRTTYGEGGIHDTLLVIPFQLDEAMRTWPPQHDIGACRALAHEATKHLGEVEVDATLLAGPPQWRHSRLEAGCTVDHLHRHLKRQLENSLAAGLSSILGKWVEWDIRRLVERRKNAVLEAERLKAAAEAQAARPMGARQRPSRRELSDRPGG